VRVVVAVHDPPVWTLPEAEVHRIAQALSDAEVVDARTPEARANEIPGAVVLLATRISRAEAASARRLRWIQSTAVGVAGLMVPEIVDGPVVVTNVRGVHSAQIAEHAVALVLALRRRLHVAVARQGARVWAQGELQALRTPVLADSRLVVVGLGAIGSRVAALAAGLGMRVTGVRRRVGLPTPPGVEIVVGPDALRAALATADAVVLAAPRTAETGAMIGADELAAMRPTAVLVNVARGRLVDEAALVAALEAGRLAGAGLDAFAREPLPEDHPLWRLPNVLVTPHTAAFGADYWAPAVDLFLENVSRFRRGDLLLNVVDKARGY
jgi:phosphoglycerate dehydrogenase-like enzyme